MNNSRKLAVRLVLVSLACVLVLTNIDEFVGYGGPPPADYDSLWDEQGLQPDCGYSDETIASLNRGLGRTPTLVRPGGGEDRMTLGPGTIVNIFDSASAATVEEHDILFIRGFYPRDLKITRHGLDLMICGRKWAIQTVLIRQYCHNDSRNPPWNNRMEEIVFPEAKEVWLADELYDALPADSDFPGAAYRARLYDRDEEQVYRPWIWQVKPFRDTLPGAWLSSIQCRMTAAQ